MGGAYDGGTGNKAPEDIRFLWDHHNELTRVEYHDINGNVKTAVEYVSVASGASCLRSRRPSGRRRCVRQIPDARRVR